MSLQDLLKQAGLTVGTAVGGGKSIGQAIERKVQATGRSFAAGYTEASGQSLPARNLVELGRQLLAKALPKPAAAAPAPPGPAQAFPAASSGGVPTWLLGAGAIAAAWYLTRPRRRSR